LVDLEEVVTDFAFKLGSFLPIIVIEIFVRGRTTRADEMMRDFE
jgi:hypothetical protein